MTEDTDSILAMHDAKMSVDSIATLMGEEPCRIAVVLDQLLKARAAETAPQHEPEVIERRVEPGGCAPAVYVVETLPRRDVYSRPGLAAGEPAKPPPTAYLGVTPEKLRYCRWFIAAGWRLGRVAWLFDLEPEDLAEALAA